MLVDDSAVIHDMKQLILLRSQTNFGDEDLYFERLHFVRKCLSEDLCVLICQSACINVQARKLIALQVCCANACYSQLIKLVVFTNTGKSYAIVNLTDLAQRIGWVLGYEHDAIHVLQCHQRPTAGNSLARVVGSVFHHLFRRYIKRHAHR